MALTSRKRRATRQPAGAPSIDRSHWLGSRIIAGLDARGYSLTGKALTRIGSTQGTIAMSAGVALDGNNARLISEAFPSSGVLAYPFTMAFLLGNITRTANADICGGLGNTAGDQLGVFQFVTSSNNRFVYRNVSGGAALIREFSANATASNTGPVWLSVTVNSASSADVYWLGTLDNGTTSYSTSGTPAMNRFAIGGVDRATDSFADTGTDPIIGLVIAGALTAAEHKRAFGRADRGWDFLKGAKRRVMVQGAGGTDYPVTQTESATGSDTTSCLIGYAPAATEAGSASDAASAAMAAVVAIIEAASAADSVNGTASGDYTATITEAATASSLEAAVSNYLAAISESASASDSASASLPGEYSVSISEAASAIETAVCAMSALVTINEAAAAADVANWVGAITFTRAPRGSGYPGTPPTTTRTGQTNTARPKMANTRR